MNNLLNKTFCLALLSLALLPVGAQARSAKALGMGDAGAAYPQDALSSVYNPANAACVGTRYDSWTSIIYSPYDASVKKNPIPGANVHAFGRRAWWVGSAMGLNVDLCNDFALGFTFSNRTFQKTHYNKPSVLAGKKKLGHGYELYAASTVLAYSWRCHHFGLSLDLLIGRHKASGAQNFDTTRLTVLTNNVTNRGYDWNWGLGVRLGWLWEVSPTLCVGIYYSPETKMSRFHKYEGFVPERGVVHNAQRVNSGLSWRFVECATFAIDCEYIWLKPIRGASNPIVSDPVKTKLGSKGGSAFGLKNELIIRGGFDYAATENLIVRLGYIFARELQRSSQSFLCVIWNRPVVNYLTTGLTYKWNRCTVVDAFYVHGFTKHINGLGSIPAYLGGGDVRMKRSLDTFGVGVGIQF